ncbi:MAG TPA: NAD-dependent epimerase/dehydratase family protein [Arenimonas sp.]|nr:NAD-dependent epimerase/dehydratase family protein [Arenimonas sp.]
MDSALRGDGRKATRVLVLGGYGFIGRHAVTALRAAGCQVRIGSRQPYRHAPDGLADLPCTALRFERLLRATDWLPLLGDAEVVLNCVGILRPRWGESYDAVHHRAPAALAEACRDSGRRLVHVSALGLTGELRSGFLRSKRDGEAAIRAIGGDWCIVRPSLLDAEQGGFGARWVRRVARWPVHALPRDARGRIAALRVEDLGAALAALAQRETLDGPEADAREFDLGGIHALTMTELLAAVRRLHTPSPSLSLGVPPWLARVVAHACDALHLTPYSYGHLELLRRDNCPRRNRLPELLGRAPLPVGVVMVPAKVTPTATPVAAG